MRHRERGLSTVGAVLLAGVAGLVAATLLADWMIVDVKVPEEDLRIVVPVPLLALRAATALIPDEALEEATVPPEVGEQREQVLRAVAALHDAPDGIYVKVDSRDAKVTVEKKKDDLLVSVDADDARVRCAVPIDGVLNALERWDWKTADPSLAWRVLGRADIGNLVTVEAKDGTRVVITKW